MSDETTEWTGVQSGRFTSVGNLLTKLAKNQNFREARVDRGQGIVGSLTIAFWEGILKDAAEEKDPETFLFASLTAQAPTARRLRKLDATKA